MTPDSELLRQFAKTNSEDAFAELVKRRVNLVYSAALRQVGGDAHLAQDVAQTVFTDLARKASSLFHRENLTGWLYTSAHFAAAKIARTENRRRDREEKFMREPLHETAPDASRAEAFAEAGADWEKLRPTLDEVMHELKETDREAVLMRYFENRQFAEVGAKLGLNENAARMRVERALEKLRAVFAKRGITTATALASVISANAVQIAPANLAATLTSASIATVGTGTFILLKFMTMAKLKLGIGALVVAGAATALVVQHQAQTKLRDQSETLRQQIAQLQADNESLSNRLAAAADAKPSSSSSLPDGQSNELLKLRGEVGVLQRQTSEASQKAQVAEQKLAAALSAKAQFELHQSSTTHAAKQIGLAMRVFSIDHENQFPTNFLQITNELGNSFTIQGISVFSFDFVNAGAVKLQDLTFFEHPNTVQLRERLARQAPDGTWDRVYGFVDGRVVTATSYDGNFDAWEKANTYLPPPNQ